MLYIDNKSLEWLCANNDPERASSVLYALQVASNSGCEITIQNTCITCFTPEFSIHKSCKKLTLENCVFVGNAIEASKENIELKNIVMNSSESIKCINLDTLKSSKSYKLLITNKALTDRTIPVCKFHKVYVTAGNIFINFDKQPVIAGSFSDSVFIAEEVCDYSPLFPFHDGNAIINSSIIFIPSKLYEHTGLYIYNSEISKCVIYWDKPIINATIFNCNCIISTLFNRNIAQEYLLKKKLQQKLNQLFPNAAKPFSLIEHVSKYSIESNTADSRNHVENEQHVIYDADCTPLAHLQLTYKELKEHCIKRRK